MRSHRITILIAGIVAASIAATPAAAKTSTLLSGYGGPGQGNQAILGATVVKGGGGSSRGGGGGAGAGQTSGSGGGEGSSSEPSLVATEASSSAGHSASGASGAAGQRTAAAPSAAGHAPAGAHAPAARGKHPAATKHVARPTVAQASFYPASERLAPGQQDSALGLSGADLLYVLLGAAVLVSLGVLTRRIGDADGRSGAGG